MTDELELVPKTTLDKMGKLYDRIEELEKALRLLDIAASRRDNSIGDPIRLMEAKNELWVAAKYARTVLANGV